MLIYVERLTHGYVSVYHVFCERGFKAMRGEHID